MNVRKCIVVGGIDCQITVYFDGGFKRSLCDICVSQVFFFFIEEEETSLNFVCTSPFNYITLCSSWKRVVFFQGLCLTNLLLN